MNETITACECQEPGWCPRHQCRKSAFHYELCRRREDYFRLWEMGVGIGQETGTQLRPPPRCQYRSLQPIDEIPCEFCGQKDLRLPVYACELFGECTERRFGNSTKRSREMIACLSCEQYSPVDIL